MARGGRVIYKKATTSKNRKARSKREGDDDEDEEYVVEEDEDEESESNFGSDANSRDLSDEESFDFRGSDRSDDEEEKEIKIARSKKKRGNRRKSRVFDDEMDADYELDDEEEEKAVEIARSNKKRRNLKKSRFSDDEMDSDYELNDDEDEKEFEIAKSKKKQVNRRKSRVSDNEMESDYEFDGEDEDEEVKIARSKKKKRNMKKSRDSDNEIDSDYEFDCEEERKEVKVARSEKRRTLKKYGISDDDLDPDYKLDDEEEEREVEIGRLKKKSVVSADEMDSNYELDHEEEDEEFEIEIPKRKQGDHNKNRVFDYEMEDLLIPKRRGRGRRGKKETGDSDYELDDEDDEKQFNIARSKKNRGSCKKSGVSDDQDEEKELLKKNQENCKKSRVSNDKVEDISVPKRREKGRPKKQKSRDSDYELDGEDFEDEDFSPNEDDFDEDEIAIASKRRAKVSKTKGRKKRRQKCVVKSSDDDFIVKDRVSVGRKRIRSMNARKRSSEADLEYLDFVTSDDDFVEKDIARINNCRKTNKNVMKGPGLRGRRKKRSVRGSESSDSDFVISDDDDDVKDEDNFNVKDQMVSDKQEMNRKKEVGKSNRRKRRKKSMVDSESSDSDYLISEDDEDFIIEEDHVMQRKKSKKGRKKGSRSSVYYDSESFDFDDAISEEEVRDMRIGGGLNREKPKRVIAGKKVEEKGKEKQADDLGKQVCGICLSEEKKSVVQGLLNCCTHYFCFACIMEWSKVESRCPLCKRRFATISKLGKSNPGFGMKSSVIRVKKRDQVYQPSEGELRGMLDPYENVVCMECQQGGDDNLMLLCDTCDSSAHTYCVGLGREVPEGNWYCECCRSVSEGPSNSQFQDTMLNQETRNTNLFCGITERSGFSNAHVSINSPRPSSLRIDLNASPRDFPGEDHFVSTPTSGSGASTVSGRRHIRQRIHVILSNNRQRQANAEATIPASVNLNPLPSVSSSERRQQNLWPFFRSRTNLASCMINEGSSFRHVDHAKEEVQHLVKCHLKNLSQNRILDRSTFKEIARKSTHTILAACGIEHRRNMVSTAIEPPENCVHDSNDGPSHLLKGCCSSCFESFVKDVLQQKIDTTS